MAWLTSKFNWGPIDYYNAEDLNRVENNTIEVANLVNQLVANIELEAPKVDRDYSSIEFADSLNRVERNIQKLLVLNLPGLINMKTNWQAGDPFSYNDANRLEKNLAILYPVLNKNISMMKYCGTFNCGEEVL